MPAKLPAGYKHIKEVAYKLKLPKRHQKDITVHDKASIKAHPDCSFLWMINQNWTDLVFLCPEATTWDFLYKNRDMYNNIKSHGEETRLFHWNGKDLIEIDEIMHHTPMGYQTTGRQLMQKAMDAFGEHKGGRHRPDWGYESRWNPKSKSISKKVISVEQPKTRDLQKHATYYFALENSSGDDEIVSMKSWLNTKVPLSRFAQDYQQSEMKNLLLHKAKNNMEFNRLMDFNRIKNFENQMQWFYDNDIRVTKRGISSRAYDRRNPRSKDMEKFPIPKTKKDFFKELDYRARWVDFQDEILSPDHSTVCDRASDEWRRLQQLKEANKKWFDEWFYRNNPKNPPRHNSGISHTVRDYRVPDDSAIITKIPKVEVLGYKKGEYRLVIHYKMQKGNEKFVKTQSLPQRYETKKDAQNSAGNLRAVIKRVRRGDVSDEEINWELRGLSLDDVLGWHTRLNVVRLLTEYRNNYHKAHGSPLFPLAGGFADGLGVDDKEAERINELGREYSYEDREYLNIPRSKDMEKYPIPKTKKDFFKELDYRARWVDFQDQVLSPDHSRICDRASDEWRRLQQLKKANKKWFDEWLYRSNPSSAEIASAVSTLSKVKKDDLLQIARQYGLDVSTKMTKDFIANLIATETPFNMNANPSKPMVYLGKIVSARDPGNFELNLENAIKKWLDQTYPQITGTKWDNLTLISHAKGKRQGNISRYIYRFDEIKGKKKSPHGIIIGYFKTPFTHSRGAGEFKQGAYIMSIVEMKKNPSGVTYLLNLTPKEVAELKVRVHPSFYVPTSQIPRDRSILYSVSRRAEENMTVTGYKKEGSVLLTEKELVQLEERVLAEISAMRYAGVSQEEKKDIRVLQGITDKIDDLLNGNQNPRKNPKKVGKKSALQKRVEARGKYYSPDFDSLYLDEERIGTPEYKGEGYFWAHDYRHYLRGHGVLSPAKLARLRKTIHKELLAKKLTLDGVSAHHEKIIKKHYDKAYGHKNPADPWGKLQRGEVPPKTPLAKEIETLIKGHFPKSTVKVMDQRGNAILIVFTLWKKGEYPNNIAQNDPLYHQIWVWDVPSDKMRLELSQGNRLWGYNATNLGKIGWRNASGDKKKILRTLDAYFGKKMKKIIAENKEALAHKKAMARKNP